MDNATRYRDLVTRLLKDYAALSRHDPDVEATAIIDTETDNYQVMIVGWSNSRRIYGPVLHLRIRNGKIWVEHNGTEMDIGQRLVEAGVPRSDIVLGFQSPRTREFTDYAVG